MLLWKVGGCNWQHGPSPRPACASFAPCYPVGFFVLASSQAKAIIFLLRVGLFSWMEPSPLLGQPLPAVLQAPLLAVPISAILQSGRKNYLPCLVLGGGGSWRRGGCLQVLWVLQKAQGMQQLMVWTGFRVKTGIGEGCLRIKIPTVFRGMKMDISWTLKLGGNSCM